MGSTIIARSSALLAVALFLTKINGETFIVACPRFAMIQ